MIAHQARGYERTTINDVAAKDLIAAVLVLYVHLWVLEGAIRKWAPGTDMLFYVLRDGIFVLGLAFAGFHSGRRRSAWPVWVFAIGLTTLAILQVFGNQIGISVAIIGLRGYIAPLLVVYAVWRYNAGDQLPRLSRIIVAYLPVQLALVVVQVLSPPESSVNKQVGSEVAYFVNDGVVRASGTFSAPAGLTAYMTIAIALSLSASSKNGRARFASLGGVAAGLLVAALSGARSTVATAIILIGIACWRRLRSAEAIRVSQIAQVAIAASVIVILLSTLLRSVVASFETRLQEASRSESVVERLEHQVFGFLDVDWSLLGSGIGRNSQAGIGLGSGGPWYEVDTVRWTHELGFFGLLLSIVLLGLCISLIIAGVVAGRRTSDQRVLLGLALALLLLFSQPTQFPTAQAGVAIAGAFTLCYPKLLDRGNDPSA